MYFISHTNTKSFHIFKSQKCFRKVQHEWKPVICHYFQPLFIRRKQKWNLHCPLFIKFYLTFILPGSPLAMSPSKKRLYLFFEGDMAKRHSWTIYIEVQAIYTYAHSFSHYPQVVTICKYRSKDQPVNTVTALSSTNTDWDRVHIIADTVPICLSKTQRCLNSSTWGKTSLPTGQCKPVCYSHDRTHFAPYGSQVGQLIALSSPALLHRPY